MDVVVSLDYRFEQTADGRVWTPTVFPYSFWTRYLEAFDGVRIVARARRVEAPSAGARRVCGKMVCFAAVPYYVGPWEYLRKAADVRRTARAAIGRRDAVILRAAGELPTVIAPRLWRTGHPYGMEVVGDPAEAFAPGAMRHPLRPVARWRAVRALKRQCAAAAGVAYVTREALEGRYPSTGYTAGISDVEIGEDFAAAGSARPEAGAPRMVFVGSFEQMYKGPDVLLDALAACIRSGVGATLTMIGEGRHLGEMRERAAALGIAGSVRFTGQLAGGRAVREELERNSLFVLPSRTEGLPRAMLEAMALGLPCIGSAVGGIPELLAGEDLAPAGDAGALARKILEVSGDAGRMRRMAERNRRRAAEYTEAELRPRRLAFYRHIARATAEWADGGAKGLLAPALPYGRGSVQVSRRAKSHPVEETGNACAAYSQNV